MHELLVNHLVKLAQEKVRLGEYGTDRLDKDIAVDSEVKNQI